MSADKESKVKGGQMEVIEVKRKMDGKCKLSTKQ